MQEGCNDSRAMWDHLSMWGWEPLFFITFTVRDQQPQSCSFSCGSEQRQHHTNKMEMPVKGRDRPGSVEKAAWDDWPFLEYLARHPGSGSQSSRPHMKRLECHLGASRVNWLTESAPELPGGRWGRRGSRNVHWECMVQIGFWQANKAFDYKTVTFCHGKLLHSHCNRLIFLKRFSWL